MNELELRKLGNNLASVASEGILSKAIKLPSEDYLRLWTAPVMLLVEDLPDQAIRGYIGELYD